MAFTRLEPNSVNVSANFTFANVTASYFVGDGGLLTNISGGGGSTYSNANVANYLPTYTGNVSANYFIGNGSSLTELNASNIATGTIPTGILGNSALYVGTTSIALNRTTGSQTLTGVSIDGSAASATTAGTVTTNAQPNITSTGTLTSVTVTGLITATAGGIKVGNIQDTAGTNTIQVSSGTTGIIGNLNVGTGGTGNVTATYFIGDGSQLTGISGGGGAAISNGTSNVSIAASGGNITASVAGNADIAVFTGTGANINGYLTVTGALSTGGGSGGSFTGANVISANYFIGVLTTPAQPNITSTGTLSSFTVTGNAVHSGWTTLQQSTDVIATPITGATGTVTHDLSTGVSFYHSSISANFTPNFTNVPTTDNRTIVVTLLLSQGSTPYYASACQIDGTSQTIKWPSATAPTATASRLEFQSFALIRVGGAWQVTSQLASFG